MKTVKLLLLSACSSIVDFPICCKKKCSLSLRWKSKVSGLKLMTRNENTIKIYNAFDRSFLKYGLYYLCLISDVFMDTIWVLFSWFHFISWHKFEDYVKFLHFKNFQLILFKWKYIYTNKLNSILNKTNEIVHVFQKNLIAWLSSNIFTASV